MKKLLIILSVLFLIFSAEIFARGVVVLVVGEAGAVVLKNLPLQEEAQVPLKRNLRLR